MRTLFVKSVRIFRKTLIVFARYFAILICLKRLLQITSKYGIIKREKSRGIVVFM